MKEKMKGLLLLINVLLLFSCNRSASDGKEQVVISESISGNNSDSMFLQNIKNNNDIEDAAAGAPEEMSLSFSIEENQDLLTEYYWGLSDGRRLENPSIETYDWIGSMTPSVRFHIYEIRPGSDVYQVRLRKEMFYFLYQTEERNKFYPIGTAFGAGSFEINFGENFAFMTLNREGIPWGRRNRVNQQENSNYPLVGIWGEAPFVSEYRLVDPIDCIYYMEIDKEIPNWAVREGTYLLKQTGESIFETISSFPDGRLRLEVRNNREILLRPLFTPPDDEEGLADILIMNRSPIKISDLTEEDINLYSQ